MEFVKEILDKQHADLENVKMELELLMHCVIPIRKDVLQQERPASAVEELVHHTQEQYQLVQDILEVMEIVKEQMQQLQEHVHQKYAILTAIVLIQQILNAKLFKVVV